ncbi:MAG TPA: hypothetical protein VLU46_11615 [Thermoanaerobaculia bacterium]|nr:hypothetical protein [Thermoanaerobaculia bacterium]
MTLLSILGKENPDMLRRIIVVTGVPDAAVTNVLPRVGSVLRR